jgi:hypothetical protein
MRAKKAHTWDTRKMSGSVDRRIFASRATQANNLQHIEGSSLTPSKSSDRSLSRKNQSDFLSQPLGTEVKDTFTGDSASRVWL